MLSSQQVLALAASRAELNFCKMQQLHRRKLRRPVGATARNSVCRTSTCSQNFARVSARLFSILPAPERGSKMAGKIGVCKAKFCFRRHSFGSHCRPLLSVPTSEPEMRKLLDKAHEILEAGTQPSSQPGPAVTSHHSGPFPQDLRCSCQ